LKIICCKKLRFQTEKYCRKCVFCLYSIKNKNFNKNLFWILYINFPTKLYIKLYNLTFIVMRIIEIRKQIKKIKSLLKFIGNIRLRHKSFIHILLISMFFIYFNNFPIFKISTVNNNFLELFDTHKFLFFIC
jgi:hypothetical protein